MSKAAALEAEMVSSLSEITQEVISEQVTSLSGNGDVATRAIAGSGFSYRHYWGAHRGVVNFTLNWRGVITRNTRVFVTATEVDAAGNAFIGAASYTVNNVAPFDGGVRVQVYINWPAPIRVRLDYLIINP